MNYATDMKPDLIPYKLSYSYTIRILRFTSYSKAKSFVRDLLRQSSEIEDAEIKILPFNTSSKGIRGFDRVFVKFKYTGDIDFDKEILKKLLKKYESSIMCAVYPQIKEE